MPRVGRKPRAIAVRTVGYPTAAAAEAFARLLLAREQARPSLALVPARKNNQAQGRAVGPSPGAPC